MRKVTNKKGFTMAELLIVVAIIAILVAIAIPTFGNQMERAREGVDLSSLRNGYTEAAAYFTTNKGLTYDYSITYKQTAPDWSIDVTEFPATGTMNNLVTSDTLDGTVQVVTFTRSDSSNASATELAPGVWTGISIAPAAAASTTFTASYSGSAITGTKNTALGTAYTIDTANISGGTSPYTISSVDVGTTGLTYTEASGTISGTLPATSGSITVNVTDKDGKTGSFTINVTVSD